MKKYLYTTMAALFMMGCSQESIVKQNHEANHLPSFDARIEVAAGRAELTDQLKINWQTDDRISVFVKSTANNAYQLHEGAGSTNGHFIVQESADNIGTELLLNGAIYPFSKKNTAAAALPEGVTFTLDIPEQQTYTPNSFDPAAFPMTAVSGNRDLMFRNVCGVLLLQLHGSRTLNKIEIKGNKGENLAGTGKSTLQLNGNPDWTFTSGMQAITLDCSRSGGVKLADTTTNFFITLPPVRLDAGFTVTLTDSEGRKKQLKKAGAQTIVRNQILRMPKVECHFSQVFLKQGKEITWHLPQHTFLKFASGQPPVEIPLPGTAISVDGSEHAAYLLSGDTETLISTTADEFVLHADCSNMFANNSNIESILFESCNTRQVTDMEGMLKGCSQLTFADLSSFNTRNVTQPDGLASMFQQMGSNLDTGTELVLGPDFVISSPQIAKNMFADARIKSIRCTPELKDFIWQHASALGFRSGSAKNPTLWYNYYTGEKMEIKKELSITHAINPFILPVIRGVVSDGLIIWGDNQQENYQDEAQHNYHTAGSYTVTIQGNNIENICFKSIKGVSKINFSKL